MESVPPAPAVAEDTGEGVVGRGMEAIGRIRPLSGNQHKTRKRLARAVARPTQIFPEREQKEQEQADQAVPTLAFEDRSGVMSSRGTNTLCQGGVTSFGVSVVEFP